MNLISSSSSSSSGSGRASPSSRATTPTSEASDSILFPNTYIYTQTPSPEFLIAAFNKHVSARDECVLGIVMDNDDGTMPIDGTWRVDELFVKDKRLMYHITSFPIVSDVLCSSPPCVSFTNSSQADQLLKLNLASLRSILALPLDGSHTLHIVERPNFVFRALTHTAGFRVAASTASSKQEQEPLPGNIPTMKEWENLWSAWDLVTLQMIPSSMLHQKPIDLRHKCLFYIGHIPTFLDMLLHKSIGGGATEPKNFWKIFERGIDPHVDDPDHCHNHSEVPEKDEDWPTLESIIGFRNGVRQRLRSLYSELETGKRTLTRNIARTLVMTLEHEGWHIETLLYMLIQRAGAGIRVPRGFITPPWHILGEQWKSNPPPETKTVTLGPADIVLGHNDSEALDKLPEHELDVQDHIFGWDNESPARAVHVKRFKADWRPVTNAEFEDFMSGQGNGLVDVPKSWVKENDEYKVRTMYGAVPMMVAGAWPVLTSYDDLAFYAKCKGGRLPTELELRLFLDTYDVGFEGGANVGFRNWHPTPATAGCGTSGRGSNGGIWEWTSTLFDGHEGLAPTNLFTGYSTDFFDTKHHIVLGASYATIPRLASRRTVRNFWQHNYPYPWVGARVVYDV